MVKISFMGVFVVNVMNFLNLFVIIIRIDSNTSNCCEYYSLRLSFFELNITLFNIDNCSGIITTNRLSP